MAVAQVVRCVFAIFGDFFDKIIMKLFGGKAKSVYLCTRF